VARLSPAELVVGLLLLPALGEARLGALLIPGTLAGGTLVGHPAPDKLQLASGGAEFPVSMSSVSRIAVPEAMSAALAPHSSSDSG
jgi:hypothetical protein